MTTTFDAIQAAMVALEPLTATYQGHRRDFCAHELGFDPQGREKVLVYQFDGTSSKGPVSGLPAQQRWRCLFVAELDELRSISGPWQTGSNRGAGNTCMTQTVEIVNP
jgi:hypothetical protein